MKRWLRRHLRLVVIVTSVAGFSACAVTQPSTRSGSSAPERASWAMKLTVVESKAVHVIDRSATDFEDTIGIRLADAPESCSATISTPGFGGPDNMIGDKIPVTVNGRPGVRGGEGAETAYLTWQLADQRWVQVDCESDAQVDLVVDAVRLRRSAIRLPFDLARVPGDYRLALVTQDIDQRSAEIYLDRRDSVSNSMVMISYRGRQVSEVGGRRTEIINGRTARIDDNPRGPAVCLEVQRQWICVRSYISDTGPYEDRADELPILSALAEDLTFADDLLDQRTWFSAEDVFG